MYAREGSQGFFMVCFYIEGIVDNVIEMIWGAKVYSFRTFQSFRFYRLRDVVAQRLANIIAFKQRPHVKLRPCRVATKIEKPDSRRYMTSRGLRPPRSFGTANQTPYTRGKRDQNCP